MNPSALSSFMIKWPCIYSKQKAHMQTYYRHTCVFAPLLIPKVVQPQACSQPCLQARGMGIPLATVAHVRNEITWLVYKTLLLPCPLLFFVCLLILFWFVCLRPSKVPVSQIYPRWHPIVSSLQPAEDALLQSSRFTEAQRNWTIIQRRTGNG